MKTIPRLTRCLALLALLSCLGGCLLLEDHLTINEDGSGRVTIRAKSLAPGQGLDLGMMPLGEVPTAAHYPPFNADSATVLFPGEALEVEHQTDAQGHAVTTVAFKNINDLLATPYAEVRALTITADEASGRLVVRSRTGLLPLTMLDGEGGDLPPHLRGKGMAEARDKAKATWMVTLPGATAAEQAAVDERTARWTIERAATPEAEQFAAQLKQVMTASCPLASARFKPAPVVRLNLEDYKSLKPGVMPSAAGAPDAQRVKEAARFVPARVLVVRRFDLSGQSGWGSNDGLTLTGAFMVPPELAPQRWGELEVTRAVDDKGNDLILKKDRRHQFMYDEPEAASGPGQARRIVTIRLATPPNEATKLKELAGSIPLHYGGDNHLVLLGEGAVLPEDESRGPVSYRHDGPGAFPETANLGVKLEKLRTSSFSGRTQLRSIATRGADRIAAVQVYDADGTPWPTSHQVEHRSLEITVLGSPRPPLTLALMIQGDAKATIDLPLHVKDLDITPQPSEPAAQ